MNKATLWFACLAAALLGTLVGMAFLGMGDEAASAYAKGARAPAFGDGRGFAAARGWLPYRLLEPSVLQPRLDDTGAAQPITEGENFAPGGKPLRKAQLDIPLAANGAVEYKAVVEAGQSFVYAWRVEGGKVHYDFHAHPPGADPDFFTRYQHGEGDAGSGAIVAPYAGQHGWYWLNLQAHPVTVRLQIAGFYDSISAIGPGS